MPEILRLPFIWVELTLRILITTRLIFILEMIFEKGRMTQYVVSYKR